MLIVSDSPLCGAINLDSVSIISVEGEALYFVGNGHRIGINCGDNVAAIIIYKEIISAYVAGERIFYLKNLRSGKFDV